MPDAGGLLDEAWVAPVDDERTGEVDAAAVSPAEEPGTPVGEPATVEARVPPVPLSGALEDWPRAAAVNGEGTDPPAAAPVTGVGDT